MEIGGVGGILFPDLLLILSNWRTRSQKKERKYWARWSNTFLASFFFKFPSKGCFRELWMSCWMQYVKNIWKQNVLCCSWLKGDSGSWIIVSSNLIGFFPRCLLAGKVVVWFEIWHCWQVCTLKTSWQPVQEHRRVFSCKIAIPRFTSALTSYSGVVNGFSPFFSKAAVLKQLCRTYCRGTWVLLCAWRLRYCSAENI